ncbi:hypothetical protein T439DRAFT_324882 [Meredithblackwellia eburnea MCA 4105]
MTEQEPSQLNGALNAAKGHVFETVAAVSSDKSWSEEGKKLKDDGYQELEDARLKAKSDAFSERMWGKAQSAYGAVIGDQETMTEGNLATEKAEWKAAAADGKLPAVSLDRAKAKVESAVGMVTGDGAKQAEGNIKAEKAEWISG